MRRPELLIGRLWVDSEWLREGASERGRVEPGGELDVWEGSDESEGQQFESM
jgi:hypothetical protein